MKNRIIIYAGQYYDRETGLHCNYHRYYDPKLGRYLRTDPIGLDGGINLYAYTFKNPINFNDPFGLIPPGWWEKNNNRQSSGRESSSSRERNVNRVDIQFWATFSHGFSNYMSEEAWNNGRLPQQPLTPIAAGFAEVFKHWLENKEFEYNPWRPWPVEYFLEPYLYDKNLEGIGDWPNTDPIQCSA